MATRLILIIYDIHIHNANFTGLSMHKVDKGQDIFVFANDVMSKYKTEKLYCAFFFGETANVKIKDVKVINEDDYTIINQYLN